MSRRAVVLAGGKGTRLRPYTIVLPKPLMPVGEYPILEVIIRQLAAYRFDRVTLAVNHQANLIQAFFGNGERWGIDIDYSLESQPLSTIAPLCLIPDLPETFLLMNGDVLTDLHLGELFERHVGSGALFTLAASIRKHTLDYGILQVDSDNILTGFKEKPSVDYLVSMGVYIVNKSVLTSVPENSPFGFDDLMFDLLRTQQRVQVYPFNGYWLDIGRPDDYMQAIEEFDVKKHKLIPHA